MINCIVAAHRHQRGSGARPATEPLLLATLPRLAGFADMQRCMRAASPGLKSEAAAALHKQRRAIAALLLAAPCHRMALPWAPSKPAAGHRRHLRVACRSVQGEGACPLPARRRLRRHAGTDQTPLSERIQLTSPHTCCCAPAAGSPAAAPGLSDSDGEQPSTSGRPPPPPPPRGPGPLRQLYKRTVKQLANLKLALGELAVIGALSAVGTTIKQGEPYSYYAQVRCVVRQHGLLAGLGWAEGLLHCCGLLVAAGRCTCPHRCCCACPGAPRHCWLAGCLVAPSHPGPTPTPLRRRTTPRRGAGCWAS